MKKLGVIFAAMWMVFGVGLTNSFASVRQYVWTEEYRTLPQGTIEAEEWVTFSMPKFSNTATNTWEFQTEVEYGLTNRLNLAHYETFEVRNRHGVDDDGLALKDSTRYTGYKFEGKYRILDKGKLPVDVLLYFEIEDHVIEHDHPIELESKIIVSKDFGRLNFTYNQILDNDIGRKDARGVPAYSFGTKYEVFPSIYAGCEFFGDYWEPRTHKNPVSIGPTLAWENQWFWIAGGVAFGTNRAADYMQARVIAGIEF